MPYQISSSRNKRKARRAINIVQKEWKKAYISTIDDSRRPLDSFSDLTNMELVQDNIVRPRPPLVRYGTQPPERRYDLLSTVTNLITNPSIEVDTTGWSAYNGGTLARNTSEFYSGVASLSIQSTGAVADSGGRLAVIGSLTPNSTYTLSLYVKLTTGVTGGFQIDTYTTADVYVATHYENISGNSAWQRIDQQVPLGATETKLQLSLYVNGTATTFYVDALQLEAGTSATEYFDGATTDTDAIDYAWTGSANASSSTKLTYDYRTSTVIGRGKFKQNGERYLLWALDDSGVGKLYKQKDGGAFTLLGGTYDNEAWISCVQNKGRLYIYNGVDNLSYVDLSDDSINVYSSLSTPGAPTVTMNGATSTGFTYYYRITANNEVGESIASTAGSDTSNKPRDNWTENTDFMTITWGSVVGATSYTVYFGSDAINCSELYTTTGTTFTDYGTLSPNVFRSAPEGNSTAGAVFNYMYVDRKSSQVFGVTADNKLYYSAPGTGDFSPYEGGGYVAIDEDGDTTLNFVTGFRNGKGDPVITTSSRGAAGLGTLNHASPETLTVGDQIIAYFNVYEANGQSGTYAPRATVKVGDSIEYPTGQDFKSTGTSQNIVGILTTSSISQGIEPDVDNINLSALNMAVGVEYRDRVYYALPVGSTSNNQIWVHDLSRRGAWILRWPINAKDLWLYEDNDGLTHFCALVDNVILQFTRAGAQPHQDDGVTWRSRAAFESLVWDDAGIDLGKVRRVYTKLLYPKGTINLNTTGLSRTGIQQATGSDSFTVTTTPTGWDIWVYDEYQYDTDPGVVNTYGKSVAVLEVKPRGLLAQLDWEVTGETAGTDFYLSSVKTKGTALTDLVLKA